MIKPLRGYIVVKPEDTKKTTLTGIELPETTSNDQPLRGKVISTGKPKILDNGSEAIREVIAGDVVVYSKRLANEIEDDSVKYHVIDESLVLAIVSD